MTFPKIVYTGRKTKVLNTCIGPKESYTELELMQRQGRVTSHCLETLYKEDPQYAGLTAIHVRFDEIYRNYSRTRFLKGLELLILLVLYQNLQPSYNMLVTILMWLIVVIWFLLAPFLVNPLMFEIEIMKQDLVVHWATWMGRKYGGPVKSWESWWESKQEKEHNESSWWLCGTIIKILFAFRFFIYHIGLVYHFTSKVYKLSWLVAITVLVVIMAMSYWKETSRDGTQRRYYYHLTESYMIITVVCIPVIPMLLGVMPWAAVSLLALAFLVGGWGLLLIAQALGPFLKKSKLIWYLVKSVAKCYDNTMKTAVHIPIQILAGFMFFSLVQTPMLCNEALSSRLATSLCV